MKRLLIFPGGQPVRPDDFQMVQDEALATSFEIIKGLCDTAEAAIVSGLKATINGNNYTISAGYFFDGEELCAVDGLSFSSLQGNTLYLVLDQDDESMRRFQDNSYHKVIQNRRYTLTYTSATPTNSFVYDMMPRMANLLSINPNPIDFRLTVAQGLALNVGYHPAGYERVNVLTNPYGDVMIVAMFTAENADGVICTIPTTIAIPADISGLFWNGTAWKRFVWQTNGNLQLYGAGTSSAVNIIQFQININVSWQVI